VLADNESLRVLLLRHLQKENRTPADRDKIDFLLVQYFAIAAPPSFRDRDVDLEDVAGVLEPVLGELPLDLPGWLAPLDELIEQMRACTALDEMRQKHIFERGREIKLAARDMYFGRTSLLAFTRFNYCVRQNFFRLLNSDVDAVRQGLDELELRGIQTLDCSALNLSADEPIAHARQMLQNWKRPQIADYATDQNFEEIVLLRTAIDAALSYAPPLDDERERQVKELERKLDDALRQLSTLQLTVEHLTRRFEEVAEAAATATANVEAAASHPHRNGHHQKNSHAEADESSNQFVGILDHAPRTPTAQADPGPVHVPVEGPLEDTITLVASQLTDPRNRRGMLAGNIRIGRTVLVLSETEANAFINPDIDPDATLRRGVAARVLLVERLEAAKAGGSKEALVAALRMAAEESDRLQKGVTDAPSDTDAETRIALGRALRQLHTIMRLAQQYSTTQAAVASF
jgi:hypothetical protein